ELDELESTTNDIFEFYIQVNFGENNYNITLNEIANILYQEIEKQDRFKW
ncbi:17121_t:CDS:1, partial [Dentiscutata heterogama]